MDHFAPSRQLCSPIVELRQYTLHPGQRDRLIRLFEREFVESQEAVGATLIGQFRDLNDPDRFVWLRGFTDMEARREALHAFYGGPVWRAHRDEANATMVDSDNVLLLRPARATSAFSLNPRDRPAPGAEEAHAGLVVATLLSLTSPAADDVLDWFDTTLAPELAQGGAALLAAFVTEASANTFPALPVREGEHLFVWFASVREHAAYGAYLATIARFGRDDDRLWQPVARRLSAAPETLKLAPTARSLLRG